jgi:hypothetical protein
VDASQGRSEAPALDNLRERSQLGRLDDPTRAPEGFFCDSPARGVRWLRSDGELEYVRCGASNRCGYCAMLTACENAVVMRLDSFDGAFPRVGLTTTTRRPNHPWAELRRAEERLWRDLRASHGRQVEYCGFLEWTSGNAPTSGGLKRRHLHHTVKGLDFEPGDVVYEADKWGREVARLPELEARVSTWWRRHTGDAWQVECRPLRTPMGAVAYLVLHHHKREQAPPPGTKHVKRLRPSRGYFNRPIADYRREARELLRDERLFAELVAVLDVPDGIPSYLVEERIVERVDEARDRAKWEAPKLVHVRERQVVDRATGEVAYRFEGVLRVLRAG